MVLWQVELGMHFEMAVETSSRVVAGIDNENAAAATRQDILAPGAVAGFAACAAGHLRALSVYPRMRAGGENPSDIRMAIEADSIAYEGRPFNHGRRHYRALDCRTRRKRKAGQPNRERESDNGDRSPQDHMLSERPFPAGSRRVGL